MWVEHGKEKFRGSRRSFVDVGDMGAVAYGCSMEKTSELSSKFGELSWKSIHPTSSWAGLANPGEGGVASPPGASPPGASPPRRNMLAAFGSPWMSVRCLSSMRAWLIKVSLIGDSLIMGSLIRVSSTRASLAARASWPLHGCASLATALASASSRSPRVSSASSATPSSAGARANSSRKASRWARHPLATCWGRGGVGWVW